MQPSNDFGCHKVPPPAGKNGDVDLNGDVADEGPDMGIYLLARLRMYVVASWFRDDDADTPAVAS